MRSSTACGEDVIDEEDEEQVEEKEEKSRDGESRGKHEDSMHWRKCV
jgi:hypothetical protein